MFKSSKFKYYKNAGALQLSHAGLVLGLVRRFRGAFALFIFVFVTFNLTKTIYPSFYSAEWTFEWPISPLKI